MNKMSERQKLNNMNRTLNTQKFLRLLSRRLASRSDCRRVEFKIGIGVRFPGSDKVTAPVALDRNYIFFRPSVLVYDDLHHRKETDLKGITEHIIQKYYPELILGADTFGNILVDTSQFASGVYEYQLAVNGKRRRWVRRTEFDYESSRR